MKLEDLKEKKISDLDQIIEQGPVVELDTPLSNVSSSLIQSPLKMVVGVDDKEKQKVVGVLTAFDLARILQEGDVQKDAPADKAINRNYVGVDISDTIADLVLKLSMTNVSRIVVTDNGKYVGIIDRQKLANKFEELLK
jgi:predicted transcriptional regulator